MSQKDGPPRVQGTPRGHHADRAVYGTAHIQVVAQPVQGWGWKGMERSIPALGRVLGWVLHQGWVLGAWFTFKPISRCFRTVSSSKMSAGTARGTDATHHSSLSGYGER